MTDGLLVIFSAALSFVVVWALLLATRRHR